MVAITEFISARTSSHLSNADKNLQKRFYLQNLIHEHHRFLVWCVFKGVGGINSIARALCNSRRKVNLF